VSEVVLRARGLTLRLDAPDAVVLPLVGELTEAGIQRAAASPAPVADAEVRRAPVPAADLPVSTTPRGPTIAEAERLILDPDTGKYPHASPFRDELVRSLKFACELWGPETLWEAIDESHWTTLLRRRCEQLVAKDCKAVRATEITVSRLITVVGWLRDTKRIPRDAASWPREWKKQITTHWKGVTKSDRDPQPTRLRYTREEFKRILDAADFDMRLDLLIRLSVGLRPGQVARARRSDLKLPPLTGDDFGSFTVHGAGKKGGVVVDLTRGQRAAIDKALADEGYLAPVEAAYQRKERSDYLLFPSGYVVGRVGMLRGRETTLRLADGADFSRHVTSSWTRKCWRRAEERAGIEHLNGRCTYGQRRLMVDVAVVRGAVALGHPGGRRLVGHEDAAHGLRGSGEPRGSP
jgi:hypothetical protein